MYDVLSRVIQEKDGVGMIFAIKEKIMKILLFSGSDRITWKTEHIFDFLLEKMKKIKGIIGDLAQHYWM